MLQRKPSPCSNNRIGGWGRERWTQAGAGLLTMPRNLLKEREEKAFNAGGGVWFRKSDYLQVFVEVYFYPKLKLMLNDGGGRCQISKEELERDYERLKV
jgi:hypothetical protein